MRVPIVGGSNPARTAFEAQVLRAHRMFSAYKPMLSEPYGARSAFIIAEAWQAIKAGNYASPFINGAQEVLAVWPNPRNLSITEHGTWCSKKNGYFRLDRSIFPSNVR